MQLSTFSLVFGSISAVYAIRKYIEYRRAVQSVFGHPGYRHLVDPKSWVSFFVVDWMPGVSMGQTGQWWRKFTDYEYFGWDVITCVSAWPQAAVTIFVADPVAIKEITGSRARFPKPVERYNMLSVFGHNIVASEGEEWRRYRKITAPAFSERNNKLVWDETIRIMLGLFDDVWGNKASIVVDHVVDITLPIALFVIGIAGFGRRISWHEDIVVPSGHSMTFKDALHVLSKDVFLKVVLPDWVPNWLITMRLRTVRVAYDELERYMLEMIEARRSGEKKEERYDLFSSLLDASEVEEVGQTKLSDQELAGNLFIFLVAGHEAINFFSYHRVMPIYPEEQDILYHHIKSIIPDDRLPTYDEMNLFTQSMAVYNETLRLFPPVTGIPKYSAEDTSIVITNAVGEKTALPIPKDAGIELHTAGLHYNCFLSLFSELPTGLIGTYNYTIIARYWKDPTSFKPARFLGDWPRDAFLPFSSGPRACLGRRFFETEGIAILTLLVSRYTIELKDEPAFAGETSAQKQERILQCYRGLTLTPKNVPLIFKRR